MAKDNLVLLGRAVLSTFIFFLFSFRGFQAIKKIRVRRILKRQEEKSVLKERLELLKIRFLQDKRAMSTLQFYNGGKDYEEAVYHRTAINIKDYLHYMVDFLNHDLSEVEIEELEDDILMLIDLKDDLDLGSIVYVYSENLDRLYGEIILKKYKIDTAS